MSILKRSEQMRRIAERLVRAREYLRTQGPPNGTTVTNDAGLEATAEASVVQPDSVRVYESVTIRANQVVLVVDSFAPIIQLSLSPRIEVAPAQTYVDVRPEIRIDVPPIDVSSIAGALRDLPAPHVVNQITVSPADIREVRVALERTALPARRIELTGPSGEYVGTVSTTESQEGTT